jgi:epoxyqueuosine reductase
MKDAIMIRSEQYKISFESTLREKGAHLVGFANVSMLPSRVTGELPRAVSIGVALDPNVVREISSGPTRRYYAEYKRVNDLLASLCEWAAGILIQAGYQAEAVRATTDKFDPVNLSTRTQHKSIATRAGLGWIGKSALLITKEYGPAVRFGSVLTDAEFKTAEPVDESHCGDCHQCVDLCPAKAIKGHNWCVGDPREAMYNAFACRDMAKRLSGEQGIVSTICGICINACPWTQKYLSRTSSA